jgi:uncharacterized protein DUF1524
MIRRRGAIPAMVALAVLGSGCTGEVGLSGETPPPERSQPGAKRVSSARADLAQLKIASEGSGAGYDREDFGQRWRDIDRNGCDQRNDVLDRDLTDVRKRGRCVVLEGRLNDPYSGKRIAFSKSDAMEVQIDHLYPLALAWRMGADSWSSSQREKFANDHDNLLAVWGVPNRQKSDSGPGEWKPQRAFQCTYAVRYIAVARQYKLPITRADRTALDGFLDRCES